MMVDQDECQDCGGMGALYEHGRRCRTPDFCVGNGDYWSCVDGEWVACPTCGSVEPVAQRVLIYGSRTWVDSNAVRDVVLALDPGDVVIHGGAAGADALAGKWAKACGLRVEVFKADWSRYGKAAGPIRNQQMIDQGHPTRAYGFRVAGASPGTDDCTRRLKAAGIPHEVFTPSTECSDQE